MDGQVRYPERRVYLEVQGWLTKRRRTPGHDSEHVHSGTCFPQGQTWARKVRRGRLDYRQRERRVTIPASGLAPGTHRLVYLAHEGGRRRITSTAVTVVPFRVG